MLKLYIANKNYSSWSLRPWVLLKTLGIPFKEQVTPFLAGSSWDLFRSFSPNGLVPCLHDGDLIVWESLAITEYLAENHSGVWPTNPEARAWARCAVAEMHAGFFALRNECPMNCGIRVRLHSISSALQADLDRIDELWNEGLARFQGPYLAGNSFGAVDAFFAPVAFRMQSFDLPFDPPARTYAQRLINLDGMREWYAAALQEPWREISHEQEILDTGLIIQDLRVA